MTTHEAESGKTGEERDGVLELARSWEQTARRLQTEKRALHRLVLQQESFIMEHCTWNGIDAHQARKAVRMRMMELFAELRSTEPTELKDARLLRSDLIEAPEQQEGNVD